MEPLLAQGLEELEELVVELEQIMLKPVPAVVLEPVVKVILVEQIMVVEAQVVPVLVVVELEQLVQLVTFRGLQAELVELE
jgi:hypothetical protein